MLNLRELIYGVSSPFCLILFARINELPGNNVWKSEKPLSCLKCLENEEKFDNDYVLRNDHRIKTTQPISMILVSFFSEDNVLSDEIKICYIFDFFFEYQSNENRAFRFLGTPGVVHVVVHVVTFLS